MNKKIERGRATREQFLDVATHLFGEQGYEGASIDAVLQASGASRGSLYHHFASKEALFEAVFERVEVDIAQQTVAATTGLVDPVEVLRVGSLAWIRLAGDPVVQRIVLIDAPSVLGWHRWREIEERHAFGLVKEVLELIAETGRLPAELVDLFAHMVLASLNEITLLIARSTDRADAQRMGETAVDELLQRLLRAD